MGGEQASADTKGTYTTSVSHGSTHSVKVQFPGYDKKMILITELVGSSEGIADAYKAGTEGNKYESTVYQVADVVERGYKTLLMRLK